jgi:CDP-diacylglycerol--serine O-phosphatidyltransferase
MRLARFNVQAGNLKHFVGLPIPAAGGTIAAIAHFFKEPITNPLGAVCFMGTVFLLSFLMVSSIRYSSFKTVALGKKSHLTVLAIALLVAAVFYYSKWTLLALAVAYVSSGILMRLYSMARRKKTNEDIPLSKPLEHH